MKGKLISFIFLHLFLIHCENNGLLENKIDDFPSYKEEKANIESDNDPNKEHEKGDRNDVAQLHKINKNGMVNKSNFGNDTIINKADDEELSGKISDKTVEVVVDDAEKFIEKSYTENGKGEDKIGGGDYRNENVANNLEMTKRGISSSNQNFNSLHNADKFVVRSEENIIGSAFRDVPNYGVNHENNITNNDVNYVFLENSVMGECNPKRKPRERDWNCKSQKDICVPDRREQLCISYLTGLPNFPVRNFSRDYGLRLLDLKSKFLHDANREGLLLMFKHNNTHDDTFCEEARWSLGDYGDIVEGTDMKSLGYSKLVKDKLMKIFGDDEDALKKRKEWWKQNKENIWKAMLFPIKVRDKKEYNEICPKYNYDNEGLQIDRWFKEWGKDYFEQKSIEIQKLKDKCYEKSDKTVKNLCSESECRNACKLYEKWVEKEKMQWNVLLNKFISSNVKENNGQARNIESAYTLFTEAFKEFNKINFEKVFNLSDETYKDLCICKTADDENLGQKGIKATLPETSETAMESPDIRLEEQGSEREDNQDDEHSEYGNEDSNHNDALYGDNPLNDLNSNNQGSQSEKSSLGVNDAEGNSDSHNSTSLGEHADNSHYSTEKETENGQNSDGISSGHEKEVSDEPKIISLSVDTKLNNHNDGTLSTGDNSSDSKQNGEMPSSAETENSKESDVNDGPLKDGVANQSKDLQKHNFEIDNGPNAVDSEEKKNSQKQDEKGNTDKNSGENHEKLDIAGYKLRDINKTREEIINLSKINRCNNSDSLKYCDSIYPGLNSNTCSSEEKKYLCCSISDYCLRYFYLNSKEYYDCVNTEFADPLYKCFKTGYFSRKTYFAGGGILLLILFILASTNILGNNSEEATFNEYEEYCDKTFKLPIMHYENMQASNPLDYS
ncbi:duffy-binding protein, putative [Plasmodium ovale]|uniref:Duffy-binding protein, putative n=1 Tax=Plasmodium ovale TaxID=36330 RepID=A0A1C3KQ34_PLAOA|nr:duffy-binding protein, putative [Plasmodium ovale]